MSQLLSASRAHVDWRSTMVGGNESSSQCDVRPKCYLVGERDFFFTTRVKMAGHQVTLKGPEVIKEICLGIIIGLSIANVWKKKQWDMKKRTT
ncbi:Cytochrome c oxidase subunit 5C-2 [Camellia lanceoleosa]|uniref:Cytochrome c oxidase subunit 5C-2 n=1 Tax=Camellia lanceoleosa TaxID=1840588 RepID=A0ACC0FFZ5_9ERIC|nr:Cytochrome c oxidase subunit 5C-2 [Camellia lanceoleosa]